jgi:hypothetical protein
MLVQGDQSSLSQAVIGIQHQFGASDQQLVGVSLRGTPRRRENRGGLPADAGSTLGREPVN